jgi:hypothetical protein
LQQKYATISNDYLSSPVKNLNNMTIEAPGYYKPQGFEISPQRNFISNGNISPQPFSPGKQSI